MYLIPSYIESKVEINFCFIYFACCASNVPQNSTKTFQRQVVVLFLSVLLFEKLARFKSERMAACVFRLKVLPPTDPDFDSPTDLVSHSNPVLFSNQVQPHLTQLFPLQSSFLTLLSISELICKAFVLQLHSRDVLVFLRSREETKLTMAPSIGLNLRVTGHCNQGGRKYMEDVFSVAYQQTDDEMDLEYAFFGIFDGHGGKEAAVFAKVAIISSIDLNRTPSGALAIDAYFRSI